MRCHTPNGIRTRVTALKGRGPRPLADGGHDSRAGARRIAAGKRGAAAGHTSGALRRLRVRGPSAQADAGRGGDARALHRVPFAAGASDAVAAARAGRLADRPALPGVPPRVARGRADVGGAAARRGAAGRARPDREAPRGDRAHRARGAGGVLRRGAAGRRDPAGGLRPSPVGWSEVATASRSASDRAGRARCGEAVDERLGRPVAVKILHPWAAADADARGRFRREAAAMARLDHPNVVAVLDYGEDEHAWLVQALCTGGTLGAVLPSAPLPWPRVVALALPIARALAHAHAQGVIHRDLKPSNVLFGADGHVLVGDFGLARLVAGGRDDHHRDRHPPRQPGVLVARAGGRRAGVREDRPLRPRLPPVPAGHRRAARSHPARTGWPPASGASTRTRRPPAPSSPACRPRPRRSCGGSSRARRRPVRARPTSSPSWRAARRRPPPGGHERDRRDGGAAGARVDGAAPGRARRPWSRPLHRAPGFSSTTGLVSLVLIGLGLVIAAIAAARPTGWTCAATASTRRRASRRTTRGPASASSSAPALTTFGLAVLAVWSVRAAGRGRRATTRALMTAVALLACAAAAAAVVWTAYAAGGDAGDLWRRASLG